MSTISTNPASSEALAGNSWTLAAVLKRWSMAYLSWRLEQAAIVQLGALSDCELKDIGLRRCEIEGAVRSEPKASACSIDITEKINAECTPMKMNSPYSRQTKYRMPVIALHCSGAGASEWYSLADALGDDYQLLAPEHYGSATNGAWTGEHDFTLADDAARAIALMDASQRKVHLVGHSYGGGVALHVALARPSQIASISIYEPSAFHLLRQLGASGAKEFSEIAGVARRIADGVLTGDYRRAVAGFVDYWNGAGTWETMRPAAQRALMRWAPKGPLEFRALIENSTPARAYRILKCPVLIMRGGHALRPSRIMLTA